MGNRTGFVAAVVLGTLLLGSASMAAGQEKAPTAKGAAVGKDARQDSLVLAKLVEAYRMLIYSAPQQCGSSDCSVQITFSLVNVNGEDVCIAKLPSSLMFTVGSSKTITWTLNPGGMLIEFPTNSGIVVVDDAKSQIKPDNARTSPVVYGATNKNNVKATATYVPVILYRAVAGQPPSVCATGDPQIANN